MSIGKHIRKDEFENILALKNAGLTDTMISKVTGRAQSSIGVWMKHDNWHDLLLSRMNPEKKATNSSSSSQKDELLLVMKEIRDAINGLRESWDNTPKKRGLLG